MFSEPRSDDVLALLAAPPEDEYALLEFALDWPGLHGVEAQLAAALRLFVITRDPLDWLADRGCAWATANANGDTLELPMYITRDEVQRQMRAGGGGLETTLGTMGGRCSWSRPRLPGLRGRPLRVPRRTRRVSG